MTHKTGMEHDRHPNRWRPAIWGGAALLLALPAVAMRFTAEVDWTAGDFIVMGAMLFAACAAYELAARSTDSPAYRLGAGVAVIASFLLVWINLAVGIINTEGDPANLVFAAVLAVGVFGAAAVRCRPAGMARVMVGVAIAQALAGGFALYAGQGPEGAVLSVVFVALWLASAWLFGRAATRIGDGA